MKKLLALVLALVMTLGLATVSSNAAFTDQTSIKHEQAVNTLVSLGVIDGMPDGSFQPEGTVTRAQMAKMITILALGDVSVSAFEGTQTDLTDIAGHWAEAYIKYCYSQGIIAGRGNGLFDPEANVTTTEAAKMGLTAIGYNSDVQGYTGENWKINVTRDAQVSGFFAELSNLTADKALTRDEAAQMLLNTADADMIEATPNWGAQDGKITYTYAPYDAPDVGLDLLQKTFKAYTYDGYFTQFSYNKTDKKWTYTIDAQAVNNANAGAARGWTGAAYTLPAITSTQHTPGTKNTSTNVPAAAYTFDSANDYTDMYGARVKVLYGQDNNNDVVKIYGMNTTKTSTIVTNVAGNLPTAALSATAAGEKEIKIDGTAYSLTAAASATPVFFFVHNQNLAANNVATASIDKGRTLATAEAQAMYLIKLVDVTGDNKGDFLMIYPAGVNKVNYVGAGSFTTINVSSNGVANNTFLGVAGTKKIADVDVYDGIAKDDYVLATPAANTAKNTDRFEKLTFATATVSAVKSSDNKAQVGGNWLSTELLPAGTIPEAGDEINFVVNNGFIVFCEGASVKGADSLVVVKGAAAAVSGVDNTQEVKLLNYEGTTLTGRVKKIDGTVTGAGNLVAVGNMYSYKINSDGYYELTSVSGDRYFPKGTVTTNAAAAVTTVDPRVVSGFNMISAEPTAAAQATNFNTTRAAATGSYTTTGGAQSAQDGVALVFTVAGSSKDATINKYTVIADDAVIWVYDTTKAEYSVTNGAQLKKNSTATNVMWAAGTLNSTTNYTEVKAAYVSTSGLSTTKNYGFVLSDVTRVADGNKFYVTVQFWDGSKVQELRTESYSSGDAQLAIGGAGAYGLSKRSVFTYELTSDGKLKNVANLGLADVAVDQYSGSNITFETQVFYTYGSGAGVALRAQGQMMYTIDSDTKIFYVNSDTPEGVTSGSINLGNKTRIDTATGMVAGQNYYLSNAFYYDDDGNGDLELLVIDVNGNMKNVK